MAQAVKKKKQVDRDTLPVQLKITDVEKKKGLSKYYVYVIQVTCRNGSHYVISRRYRQFDEMQKLLEQRFPVEAGEFSQKERILPILPGKLYLSRSAVREVTDKRLPLLNSYLQRLFSLADNIRYDSIVKSFTRQTPQDRERYGETTTAPTTTTTTASKPLRPALPTHKKTTAPVRPAPPSRPAPPKKPPPPPALVRGPRGKAVYDYTAQYSDELSFSANTIIGLETEVDGSWVIGRLGSLTGLVPLSYLSIIQPLPTSHLTSGDGEQSDEWDSEEDDQFDSSSSSSFITCYVRGVASSVQVSPDLLEKPTFFRLRNAFQDHLGRRDFVMNYRDSDGDMIEITDQEDVNLMSSSITVSSGLTIFITDQGDYTPYNTHPYNR